MSEPRCEICHRYVGSHISAKRNIGVCGSCSRRVTAAVRAAHESGALTWALNSLKARRPMAGGDYRWLSDADAIQRIIDAVTADE